MKEKTRKIIGIVAVLMLLCVACVGAASAADEKGDLKVDNNTLKWYDGTNWVAVGTAEVGWYYYYILNQGSYKLVTDVDLSVLTNQYGICINGSDTELDLNGHVLKGANNDDYDYSVLFIKGGKKLTLKDTDLSVKYYQSHHGEAWEQIKDPTEAQKHDAIDISEYKSDTDDGVIVKAVGGIITGGKDSGVYIYYEGDNDGTMTMIGGNIVGNTADYGGGVYDYGVFNMSDGNIVGNIADGYDGGGVYIASDSEFTMSGGNIVGNTAVDGGGVYNEGVFNMSGNASITGNTAAGGYGGGGVYNNDDEDCTFTMNGGSITGNTADGCEYGGGGVYYDGGTMKVGGTAKIIGNYDDGYASNVYLDGGKYITKSNKPFETGACIGVTNEYAYRITSGEGWSSGDEKYFKSDYNSYYIGFKSDESNESDQLEFIDIESNVARLIPVSGTISYKTTIGDAIDDAESGDTIQLIANVTEDITISKNLTLDLNGYVLQGTGDGSVVSISSGNTLTLIDNDGATKHYFTVDEDGLWTLDEDNGTKIVEGGVITGGTGTVVYDEEPKPVGAIGGGVYVEGEFTMKGGRIVGNTTEYGGGGVSNNGNFEMNGYASISDNTAWYGGGVCNLGTFEISGYADIYGNTAVTGGGVDHESTVDDSMTVGECAKIFGNNAYSLADNISLFNIPESGEPQFTYIKISSEKSLDQGALFGVTLLDYNDDQGYYPTTGPITTNYPSGAPEGGWKQFFVSDNDDYCIGYDSVNSKLTFNKAVAKIGDVKYGTLQEAIDTVNDGETATIDMIANTKEAVNISDGANSTDYKNITLDLHGFVIDASEVENKSVIKTGQNNKLTLKDTDDTDTSSTHYFEYPEVNNAWVLTTKTPEESSTVKVYESVSAFNREEADAHLGTSGNEVYIKVTGGVITGGTGTVIDGDKYGGGVYVDNGGTFSMISGNIVGNDAYYKGGGVYNYGGVFNMSGNAIIAGNTNSGYYGGGGGVYIGSVGKFNMSDNASITGNTVPNGYGGGVNNYGGEFIMNGGSISNNYAGGNGGGVYNYESSEFSMNGGSISDNYARGGGGGVYNEPDSTFNMNSGSISDNTAYNSGGGVCNNGTFTMKNGSISYNDAYSGGGVVNSSSFTMDDGSISYNTADNSGGGVYNYVTFTMKGGSISYNDATNLGGGVVNEDVMNVGGTVKIIDNKVNGNNNNLFLRYGTSVTLGDGTGDIPKLTGDTRIDVTLYTGVGMITSNYPDEAPADGWESYFCQCSLIFPHLCSHKNPQKCSS